MYRKGVGKGIMKVGRKDQRNERESQNIDLIFENDNKEMDIN